MLCQKLVLPSMFAVLAVAACGSPSQGPAATPSQIAVTSSAPSPTTAQVLAVAHRIFIGQNGGECSWQDRSSCPITARLAARFAQQQQPPAVGPGPLAAFCRCQNIPDLSMTAETSSTGGVAHVTMGSIRGDLVMVDEGGTLLVDDTQCTGRGAATSIYTSPVAQCG